VPSVVPAVARPPLRLSAALVIAAAWSCGGSGGPAPLASPAPANGRTVRAAPRRPSLPAGEDSCDAYAYYRYGRAQLHDHPAAAAAAFYWMQRLAPTSPLGYYSQRVALLMEDRRLLRGYIEEDRRTLQSARVAQIDSLQIRAMTLDPFFPQALDEDLLVAYFTYRIGNEMRSQATPTPFVSDGQIEGYVRTYGQEFADSSTRAWFAYGRGAYGEAAATWAAELRRDSTGTDLRARRAQALYLLGELDSARVELERALATARRAETRSMRYAYDSKVLWEYEVGRIHERLGDAAGAREAYQRALVEDLSFYPAHLRLGFLAAAGGDTATAVTELSRALEIKDDDFSSRLLLGIVLGSHRDFERATEQLRRAAEIEPWTAVPHFVMGNVKRAAGDRDGALEEYRRFLAMAGPNDPNLLPARERVAALSAPGQ